MGVTNGAEDEESITIRGGIMGNEKKKGPSDSGSTISIQEVTSLVSWAHYINGTSLCKFNVIPHNVVVTCLKFHFPW